MALTERLEQAVLEAGALPPAVQDEIAGLMLRYVGKSIASIQVTPDEEADQAEAEVEQRELASEADTQAVWSKHHGEGATGRLLIEALQAAPDQTSEIPTGEPLPVHDVML